MRLSRTLLVLGACALLAVPAFAADEKHLVRFGGSWISPTGDYSETIDTDTFTLEAADAVGVYVGYEYRLSDLMGVEAALQWANNDVDETDEIGGVGTFKETIGDIDLMPFTIALNFHLLKGEGLNLYVGPMAGYMFFGDLNLDEDDESIDVDDAFIYGAQVGVDIPLGGGAWGIQAAGQYLLATADVDAGDGSTIEVDVDPFVFQAGVRIKF